jgi:hypothetical protein
VTSMTAVSAAAARRIRLIAPTIRCVRLGVRR